MLPIEAIKLLLAFGGFLLGSFIPLAVLYLGIFIKRRGFSVKTVIGSFFRMILIPIGFLAILMIVGLIFNLSSVDPSEMPEDVGRWFATAAGMGLLGGIIAFLYGLIQGIRSIRHRKTPQDVSC